MAKDGKFCSPTKFPLAEGTPTPVDKLFPSSVVKKDLSVQTLTQSKFVSPNSSFPIPDTSVKAEKFHTPITEIAEVSKSCGPLILPASCTTQSKAVAISDSDTTAIETLLTKIIASLNGSVVSSMGILCSPTTNTPVLVRGRFSFVNGMQTTIPIDAWNLDGTKYTGDITELTSCGEGGVNTAIAFSEYFICDNGVQKIVSLCGTTCSYLEVSYYLVNRTPTVAPSDWGLVTIGACPTVQEVSLQESQLNELITSISGSFTLRLDEGAIYTYIGKALPGSLVTDAVWQIQRITNIDTTVVYANGMSTFDNIWNDRASLPYS